MTAREVSKCLGCQSVGSCPSPTGKEVEVWEVPEVQSYGLLRARPGPSSTLAPGPQCLDYGLWFLLAPYSLHMATPVLRAHSLIATEAAPKEKFKIRHQSQTEDHGGAELH